MFDNLKNMGALAGLMKDLPRLKAKIEETKERLAELTVDAETGGGAVRVTVNGQMRVISIHVEPSLIAGLVDANDPNDRSMAEDLIVGATNAALEKARELAEQELGSVASDLGLPVPPGGLGGLM